MVKSVLKLGLFLCSFIFNAPCFGQWAIPWQMRGEATLDHLLNTAGFAKPDLVYGTLTASSSSSQDTFIDPKWNSCTFLLFDAEKLLEGYFAKYDIKANALTVKAKNGIRLIEVSKIKSIVWLDSLTHSPRYFINGREYKEESAKLTGLLEVIVDGQMPLFAQSHLVEKEIGFFANLLSIFEKGDRERKMEVKKIFYTANGNAVSKITSRRDLLISFGDFYWEMEEYIQKNNLDISMQSGLQKVFEHYNTKFERLPDY